MKVENQRKLGGRDQIKHRLKHGKAKSESIDQLVFQFQNQPLNCHPSFDVCRIYANKCFEYNYLDLLIQKALTYINQKFLLSPD